MLQKQAEKNYLCSLTDKRKTMKHTNPQVEQMTSFIVMDVLERANELQKQGVDVIHLEVGEPDFDVPVCVAEAAKAAYDRHLTHYTHSLGNPELRREIAAFYQREYGVRRSGLYCRHFRFFSLYPSGLDVALQLGQ